MFIQSEYTATDELSAIVKEGGIVIITRRAILKKIDPELMKTMSAMSEQTVSIILHSHGGCDNRCQEILDKLGGEVKYEYPLIDSFSVEISSSKLMELASARYVRYIAADVSVNAQMDIASQEIKSNVLNKSGYKGKGIGIAIIDTGIYPHADFLRPGNRIKEFKDFVDKKDSPYDDNGHGSFVAGVAAGNGYLSRGKYQGIAPEADIIALKALNKDGSGNTSDILAAIQWVADHQKENNIKVLSMSLGTDANRLSGNDSMVRAVEALWDRDITVVVAAGNSGPKPSTITSPGISPKVITVGAVDDKRTPNISDDTIAEFSSRGPVGIRIKPDVTAPGVKVVSVNSNKDYKSGQRNITSTVPYTTMSGTSVATPMVSGSAAVLLQKYPSWTPRQVKGALMDNAVPIVKNNNAEGRGLIDLERVTRD
ncbi:MAG TPA: S8 family peptidase [Clostridia bacterium]|nr:S8 family peptidase [Clostridia bacterium]